MSSTQLAVCFTLIELVVVIVIIGILALVAFPKFINLRDDAKNSTLLAVSGAMQSGLELVKSKAILEGQNHGTGSIVLNGISLPLLDGEPSIDGSASFNV